MIFLKRLLMTGLMLSFFVAGFMITTSQAREKAVSHPPKDEEVKPVRAPKLPGRGTWLNTETPPDAKAFEGKLTLLYFWDYASINCLREIGILKEWSRVYEAYGLQVIWVHAPEFPFAKEKENAEKALTRLQILDPVLLDNDFKLWEAFKTHSWPTRYLVNQEGFILASQTGEGRYYEMEAQIREELKILNPDMVLPAQMSKPGMDRLGPEDCESMTAETHLGYKKAGWWGGRISNKQYVDEDQTLLFKDRGDRVERGFFAEGLWANREEYFEHVRPTSQYTDYIGLIYLAYEAYAVLNRIVGYEPIPIYVTRDDLPVPPGRRGADIKEDDSGGTYFLLNQPRLYYLVANEDQEPHELKLWIASDGVAVHSFAFANTCLSDFEHL